MYHSNDRRNGSYISRQNDPAYNREVQYTERERTWTIYSFRDVNNIAYMLAKEYKSFIPESAYFRNSSEQTLTLPQLNAMVETVLQYAVPMN